MLFSIVVDMLAIVIERAGSQIERVVLHLFDGGLTII
jgi:hypothetical protein